MKNKKIHLLLTLFLGFGAYSQSILSEPEVFKSPSPEIRGPEIFSILPGPNLPDLTNRKVKTLSEKGKLTEYTPEGKILRFTHIANLYEHLVTYRYKNGVLTEWVYTQKANKAAIERENEEQERRARKAAVRGEMGISAERTLADKESVYTATLDSKNRVIAYRTADYESIDAEKKLVSEQHVKVIYGHNLVKEVNSSSQTEKFEYDRNSNLIRKTVHQNPTKKSSSQEIINVYRYLYQNGNLVSVWNDQTLNPSAEKPYTSSRLLDSAQYDSKSRIIWHGRPQANRQFTYDSQNRLTEVRDGKLRKDTWYFYNTDRLPIRIIETDYGRKTKPDGKPWQAESILTYDSRKQLLEMGTPDHRGKTTYTYDTAGNRTSRTDWYWRPDPGATSGSEGKLVPNDTTKYIFSEKALRIENKYGTVAEYTFY